MRTNIPATNGKESSPIVYRIIEEYFNYLKKKKKTENMKAHIHINLWPVIWNKNI
jgi:hypothetical protein